ncbi:MAG: ketopantoate reductase family protein [Roseiflexaceae bacterium]
MKCAVLGAGGVGAYLGARLSRAGHPVALVARGAHGAALAAQGITVHATNETWQAHPALVCDDVRMIGVCDVVIVAAKTYDLADLLAHVDTLIGPRTLFLTIQNGIEAYARVAERVGAERVLAGLIYCEASIEAPGVIRSGIEPARLTYGPLAPHPSTAVAQALAHACTDAGVVTTLVPDGRAAVWSKAIFVAAMSAVTTISGMSMGPMMADAEAVQLLTAALTEARHVAEADGITFVDDPVAQALATAQAMPATARSSMSRDFARGRRIEADALSGAVVAKGRALGVPTPVNHALYALLRLCLQAREDTQS